MRRRHGHVDEPLNVSIVDNLLKRVIIRPQVRKGGVTGRGDLDLTLFPAPHQLDDDVLLQNLIPAERTCPAVKQVDVRQCSLG